MNEQFERLMARVESLVTRIESVLPDDLFSGAIQRDTRACDVQRRADMSVVGQLGWDSRDEIAAIHDSHDFNVAQ